MTKFTAASSGTGETTEPGLSPGIVGWAALLGLGGIDFLWCHFTGLTFLNLDRVLLALILLALVHRLYSVSRRSIRLANMAHYAALWIAFTVAGAILTYLAATVRLPLRDSELAAFDGWLHFDWIAWFNFVAASPVLKLILGLAYSSIFLQIIASIFYFCHIDKPDRNQELWWTATTALMVTTLFSALFPAAGAGEHYAVSDLPRLTYLPHLLALREGTLVSIPVDNMQGIITFPSYHTVLAVLLTYAYRGRGRMLVIAAAVNSLMLFAIPVYGSHYVVDMLAGSLVALISIWLVRAATPGRSRTRRQRDALTDNLTGVQSALTR